MLDAAVNSLAYLPLEQTDGPNCWPTDTQQSVKSVDRADPNMRPAHVLSTRTADLIYQAHLAALIQGKTVAPDINTLTHEELASNHEIAIKQKEKYDSMALEKKGSIQAKVTVNTGARAKYNTTSMSAHGDPKRLEPDERHRKNTKRDPRGAWGGRNNW